ncbi:MAG: hypothetical protein LBU66_01875, partial [Treponema sp.]|nr:hypothetical protein [Treponema sp.]
MAPKKKRAQVVVVFLLFVVYFLIAARPVPKELVLAPGWISSLDAESPVVIDADAGVAPGFVLSAVSSTTDQLLPFTLGGRFGYVDSTGQFAINRLQTSDIYLSSNMWTEYAAEPSNIEIFDITGETIRNIENPRGYPVLLDNRVFILGSEQNMLSEIDENGETLWTYEFGAPLTCIDAAAGLVLTGSLDGVIEILDSDGNRIFYFEPGGSRYEVILGCALSRNSPRFGIISGIDRQRFLLFERFGNAGGEYKVVYHEYLESSFRRPVRISFIDEDRRLVFERAGGIGCYNIRSRRGFYIPLDGEIMAIDNSGEKGFLFLITSHSTQSPALRQQELIGIKFPQDRRFSFTGTTGAQNAIFMKVSFNSDDVFLGRTRCSMYCEICSETGTGTHSMLIAGGGSALISFHME